MRPGGNNFNYFPENKLTKLENFVQFIRMLMFCLENWGLGPLLPPLGYATAVIWWIPKSLSYLGLDRYRDVTDRGTDGQTDRIAIANTRYS